MKRYIFPTNQTAKEDRDESKEVKKPWYEVIFSNRLITNSERYPQTTSL